MSVTRTVPARTGPRSGARRRLALAAGAAAALAVLITLITTGWPPLRSLDASVLRALIDRTAPHPGLVDTWKVVSEIGQPFTFQVVAVLTALALLRRGRVRLAIGTAVTVLGAGLLSTTVKAVVGRDRPLPSDPIAHAGGASFPSGHALSSAVGVTVALVLVVPHLRGARRGAAISGGVAVAALIAYSRLALGVHYVSDIAGGWLLALLWLLAARAVFDPTGARTDPDRLSDRWPPAPAPPSPGPPP